VNGQFVTSLERLRKALDGMTSGSPVTMQIQREGKLMYISFNLD